MAENDRPMTDAEWRDIVGKIIGKMYTSQLETSARLAALVDVLKANGDLDGDEFEAEVERREGSLLSFMRTEAMVDDDMRKVLEYIEQRLKESEGGPG